MIARNKVKMEDKENGRFSLMGGWQSEMDFEDEADYDDGEAFWYNDVDYHYKHGWLFHRCSLLPSNP